MKTLESIAIWVIVAWAVYTIGKVLWRQLRGFLYPSEAGCEDCQGCPTASKLVNIEPRSISGDKAHKPVD